MARRYRLFELEILYLYRFFIQLTDRLFDEMCWIIVHSLRAAAAVITSDRHCFECYGYGKLYD